MKTLLSGAVLLSFLAGLGYIVHGETDDSQTVQSGSVSGLRAYSVYNLGRVGAGDDCQVVKGRASPDGEQEQNELRLVGLCSELLPRLSEVRYWRDSDDGDVAFLDDGGRSVVEFFAADGVSYESFSPKAPLLVLDRGN